MEMRVNFSVSGRCQCFVQDLSVYEINNRSRYNLRCLVYLLTKGGGVGWWVGVSGFKAPLTASFLFIHAPPAPCAMAPGRYTLSSSATAPSPAPRDASSHVCGEWNRPSPVWTHHHLQQKHPPFKSDPVRNDDRQHLWTRLGGSQLTVLRTGQDNVKNQTHSLSCRGSTGTSGTLEHRRGGIVLCRLLLSFASCRLRISKVLLFPNSISLCLFTPARTCLRCPELLN